MTFPVEQAELKRVVGLAGNHASKIKICMPERSLRLLELLSEPDGR